jgi:hypothetical protein
MTESERQEIKAKLIELGFWDANEPGDPTSDYHNAQKLQNRAEAKLAKSTFLVSTIVTGRSAARRAMVVSSEQAHELVTADTYPESICLAALALPEFLRRHPECAADDQERVEPQRRANGESF